MMKVSGSSVEMCPDVIHKRRAQFMLHGMEGVIDMDVQHWNTTDVSLDLVDDNVDDLALRHMEERVRGIFSQPSELE